jgi:hypothetical protein
MTIKVELVDNVQKVKRKRVTCKCGKEMTYSAFEYHKLRCETYKKNLRKKLVLRKRKRFCPLRSITKLPMMENGLKG